MQPANPIDTPMAHRSPRLLVPVLACTASLLVVIGSVALAGTVLRAPAPTAGAPSGHAAPAVVPDGYWLATADGGVRSFGDARFHGSAGDLHLDGPIVGTVATPDGGGYWLVAADGGVFAFGDAPFMGSAGDEHLARPVVAMAATPDGRGYWLVAADGGVFAYGDAGFAGSMGGRPLDATVVDLAATPDGRGYWLVGADGGVFAFGDAPFLGSAGGRRLDRPVVTVAGAPLGGGYWLAAADGGVFGYGNAAYLGTVRGLVGTGSVVDLEPTPTGAGYWAASSAGGVFAFGDAPFFGSAGGTALPAPVVGLAVSDAPAVSPQEYVLGAAAPPPLLPGASVAIDLRITNPGTRALTVVSNTTTLATSSPACPPSDFTVRQGPGRPVEVPAGTTVTLGSLGVPRRDWPTVGMPDTGRDQDVCQGVQLTLHYRGEAHG